MGRSAGINRRLLSAHLLLALALLGMAELVFRLLEPHYYSPRGKQEAIFLEPGPVPAEGRKEFKVFLYGESTVECANYGGTCFIEQMKFWLSRMYPGWKVGFYNYAASSKASPFIVKRAEETIGLGPDLVIALSGHNEFVNRFDEDRFYFVRKGLNRLALVRALELVGIRSYLLFRSWTSGDTNGLPTQQERRKREAIYRENVRRFIEVVSARHVPLILCTAPSNVRDWPPHMQGGPPYDQTILDYRAVLDESGPGKVAAARARLETQAARNPQDAVVQFAYGTALRRGGRMREAREHLLRARDLDARPRRASRAINDMVRQAAGRKGVVIADVEKAFEEASPDALTGFGLIADGVHPTAMGSAIIAREILRAMERAGLLPGPLPRGCCNLNPYLEWIGYFDPNQDTRLQYLLFNAFNSMPAIYDPVWNSQDQRMVPQRFLLEAVGAYPSRWEVWANLATMSLLAGQTEKGSSELRKAVELKGSDLEPDPQEAPVLIQGLKKACPSLSPAVCLQRLTNLSGSR